MQNNLKESQYANSSNLSKRINLHERFSTNKYDFKRWVFDQIYTSESKNISELGAAQGDLWLQNKDRIPESWHITLSDFSEGMMDEAKTNLAELGNQFDFRVFDAQMIPFEEESFDIVIANHMLYHVPDIPKALVEIKRVLTPDGYLFAATNGISHMQELFNLIRIFKPDFGRAGQSFTLENGRDFLKDHFENLKIIPYENSLIVTELEPLIDYFRSSISFYEFNQKEIQQIEEKISYEFRSNGKIEITIDVGLFIASS